MNAWFIRHNKKLHVQDADIGRLWAEDRIAIHYPGSGSADSESLDPSDYATSCEQTAIRNLVRLAQEGGYVWSDYRNRETAKVGFVKPGAEIDFWDATWSSDRNRVAELKALKLERAKIIRAGE